VRERGVKTAGDKGRLKRGPETEGRCGGWVRTIRVSMRDDGAHRQDNLCGQWTAACSVLSLIEYNLMV
jgi:hypothetical protein